MLWSFIEMWETDFIWTPFFHRSTTEISYNEGHVNKEKFTDYNRVWALFFPIDDNWKKSNTSIDGSVLQRDLLWAQSKCTWRLISWWGGNLSPPVPDLTTQRLIPALLVFIDDSSVSPWVCWDTIKENSNINLFWMMNTRINWRIERIYREGFFFSKVDWFSPKQNKIL